ncbi:hypothetical protein EGI26_17065 [Lacihabitans sp. CCS-44]|uniref:hypothetical protein n=1 Tax=Lacihabitans sp. CCS-44 TaxID=2487331 RepID=UPI0020CC2B3D|nr:hypothetical protein [Lacihabitans sp. CCS-44]MCP9756878.1 hypothetical protein [Lacihabitans sp. CCS-44]
MQKILKVVTAFLLFVSVQSTAQRVDIDKAKFVIKRTFLPRNPLAEDVFFYGVNVKNSASVRQYMQEDEIASRIKIDGFQRADGQPNSVTINMNFDEFIVRKNELTSRTEETKDKAGKVTKSYYYRIKLTYTLGAAYEVKSPDNKDIVKYVNYYDNSDLKVWESSEYSTSAEANRYYNDNSASIRANILTNLVNAFTNRISSYLRYEIGFASQELNEYFWILDSKKHDEFENNQKITKQLIEEMKRFTANSKPENVDEHFKPYFDYFNKLAKLDMEEKGNKKLVYAALYNLSILSYYLDDPIQSKVIAERLIKDDIDEKDGKELVKNADYLIDVFKKNNKFSTHFERKIPEADVSLIPKKNTISATNVKIVEAPAARFLEGFVITLDDKEVEGYFFNEFVNAPWEVQDGIRFIPASLFNDGKYDKKSIEKYSPKELKGMAVEKKLYIPILFSDISKLANGSPLGATSKKYFMEVIKDGKYKLLKYFEAPPSTMVFSGSMDAKPNLDNLEVFTILLSPNEEKGKRLTTSTLEDALMANKVAFDKYQKGEFSLNGKPVNVKRDMIDRMTAKSSLDKNINLEAIMEELNKK